MDAVIYINLSELLNLIIVCVLYYSNVKDRPVYVLVLTSLPHFTST